MQSGLSLRTDLGSQIVWRQVSEDSAPFRMRPFLLIICTPSLVTAARAASSRRFSDVPAFGQILLRQRCATLGPL